MNIKAQSHKINDILNSQTKKEKLELETSLLAISFLSEIERVSDELGLKRKELAKLIEKSPSYLTQLFRGNRIPSIKNIAALSLALDKNFYVKAVDDIQKFKRSFEEFEEGQKFDSSKVMNNPIDMKVVCNNIERKHKFALGA